MPITNTERIMARITRKGDCWLWTGTYAADGYPIFTGKTGNISIIPLLWKQEYGPPPPGHVLSCIHPQSGSGVCVNPTHYRPRQRGREYATVCKRGHDLTDPNNVIWTKVQRHCLPCMVERTKRWRERRAGTQPTSPRTNT